MFSLFKKRKPSAELTFKSRVEQFWQWYASVSERFFKTIEQGKCPSLAGEVSAKVKELLPGFAWVFGPGEDGVGHSFTLSGEGDLHLQFLTIYWEQCAPELSGWTFYPSRQPHSIEGVVMDIGGQKFSPMEFWLTPAINEEARKIDITVWHPLFAKLSERDRFGPLFLFLDEVLGEFGTVQWIGEIKLNDHRLADAIPLNELPGFIKTIEADKGWKKLPPGEEWTLYQPSKHQDDIPRGDIIVGNSGNMKLIKEYLGAKGNFQNPLAAVGADYVYVAFDIGVLPQGRESEARGLIEEALGNALSSVGSGRLIGGAHGKNFGYIDLLLFDGSNSLEIVRQVLDEQQLPAGTTINYFAAGKSAQQVVL